MNRWLVLFGIASVALAGCGGGGDGSSTTTGSTKPRTATFGGPDSGRPVSPNLPGGGEAASGNSGQ